MKYERPAYCGETPRTPLREPSAGFLPLASPSGTSAAASPATTTPMRGILTRLLSETKTADRFG